jgi:hypothetical protein
MFNYWGDVMDPSTSGSDGKASNLQIVSDGHFRWPNELSILDNPKGNILKIDELTHLLPITYRLFRDSPRLKPNTADLSPLEHLTFDGRDNA